MEHESPARARKVLGRLPRPAAALRFAPAEAILGDVELVQRLVSALSGRQASDRSGPLPTAEDIAAALTLVEQVRHQVDQLEMGVVQKARLRQMGWPQIAAAQGHRSPQAATQRYQRLTTRLAELRDGIR